MISLVDRIEARWGSPLALVSDSLRGFIIAKPGHILRIADFSSIEARGLAWLAGAEAQLDVFRSGADPYLKAAEDIYGHPCSKREHPFERSVGKVVVLACGYQGSVGAFQSMARVYNVKVPDADAKAIVTSWREANPEVTGYWRACENAAIAAVRAGKSGEIHRAGAEGREVRFAMRGSFLVCRLPSGRKLYYPSPRLQDVMWMRGVEVDDDGFEAEVSRQFPMYLADAKAAEGWVATGDPRQAIHYKRAQAGGFYTTSTYGGKLVENVTQAVCRDLLVGAMLRLDAAGYPISMHVHDEVVCETPEDWGSDEELVRIMCELPGWAAGFPVGADGHSARRYCKGE